MVLDESTVLPAKDALDLDKNETSNSINEIDSLALSRPSRPCQDNGWINEDHYYKNYSPSDLFKSKEWIKKY